MYFLAGGSIKRMLAEEWYWVKFSYTDNNGNTKIDIQHVRIRWKPWEYYFDDEAFDPWDEEEMRKYLKEGTLNSRESDRAFRLMHESKMLKKNSKESVDI